MKCIPLLMVLAAVLASCGGQTAQTASAALPEIAENTVRVHYHRPDGTYENYVLWLWNDTTWQSATQWPDGLAKAGVSDYGAYYDVPVTPDATRLGMVVVDRTRGDAGKDGGDRIAEFPFPQIRELYLSQGSDEVMLYRPVDVPEQHLRVHYTRDDGNYENMVLWLWNDTTWESDGGWPRGMPATGMDEFGAYYDVPLTVGASRLGLLAVNRMLGDPGKDGGDKVFDMRDGVNRVWIRQGDDEVYTNPAYTSDRQLRSAVVTSDSAITLTFSTTDGYTRRELEEGLEIADAQGNRVAFTAVRLSRDNRTVDVTMDVNIASAPYRVRFDGREARARVGWQYIDALYAYEGWLGPRLHADGSAELKMWSPMVANVDVVLYDATDPDVVVADRIPMSRSEHGVWSVRLDSSNTGLSNLRGYFYQYRVDAEGTGDYRLALDPYAPSMAPFNNAIHTIGKGAIIDVSNIGPSLSFAEIPGYERRTDAIIWEAHVRDLTVDPSIEQELSAPFGTFEAFIDILDYVASLGVTHVQLLPVMSYMWGDDFASREREIHYSALGNNYNWGYDPHSYFSVSGMYSDNPADPERRIEELKNLIAAIHARGMGVILDVVFNHTAAVHIFEDLAPGYYHFMDADGTPRTSFGGGRLGTTHAMARRILVDSITYWTREFNVDGFRFDMMGDHDAESIQIAYDRARDINPNIIMIGEGWRTFVGDEGDPRMPADQDWMQHTDSVAVFSDDFRNELKSGFGSEGEPMFITGGPRDIEQIFDNVRGRPHNFVTTTPGDVVQYIEAHDNLTLHDVIAQSIQLDPDIPENQREIQRRIRIGNAMVLTSQGVAFLHAGQEYGRTKQWRVDGEPEHKGTYMVDADGEPFAYPWFVHDSYDSSDAINMFDWARVRDREQYPESVRTRDYTAGLIALRRSTDAFRLGSYDLVTANVAHIDVPEIEDTDLAIVYSATATSGETYYVLVNADTESRRFSLPVDLRSGVVLVDEHQAGTEAIQSPSGFSLDARGVTMDALTVAVVRM